MQPKLSEKRWNKEYEGDLLRAWEVERLYEFNPNSGKEIFAIDTPPPYPSGRPWHIGAAAHYSQIDMIARTARMLGYEVYFPIGIDRNGLPVELYTEKKYGISMHETPREKFIELCETALDELEQEMLEILRRLGLSGDFANYYRTDSEAYRKLTQETFVELWKRGLIYEAYRPNIYCPGCKTTLAEADVIYKEKESELVYLKFRIKETGEVVEIATTRPELLCACQAVIFNPEDGRYRHLEGKHVILPIYRREVPVYAHPQARPELGSGLVMICSYGDLVDIRLFRELRLEEIRAIDEEGRMTEVAGKYKGMKVREARRAIVEDLERMGLVSKRERIVHRVAICERSKDEVEFIPMKDYYLRQLDFLQELRELQRQIVFLPEVHRQILLSWMDGITIDWPISRRRYYGTEIPVWRCKRCGNLQVPEKIERYHRPWKEKPPFDKCHKCGANDWEGETKVFDTWFDSSITPLFISRWRRDDAFFEKTYPNAIRPQGKDIVRTWLYYTLLRCYQLTNELPWKKAWIMGFGVDEKGEKMSKSKGNVIDPIPILEKYGSDSFRFWAASEASLGSDFRCSERRIASAGKFLTKLWNIARFISQFPYVELSEVILTPTDEWILSEFNRRLESALKGYEGFNFFVPARELRDFLWNVFASHYLEMVKPRAYSKGPEAKAAHATMHAILKASLELLAPIIPFITDYIYRKLYGTTVHKQNFPSKFVVRDLSRLSKQIIEFNEAIWREKQKKGLPLTAEIEIEIPAELQEFQEDLVAMHRIVNR